ncbi:MAG: hypothetical protein RSF40_07390 [Oscillospiraceae bacterium]
MSNINFEDGLKSFTINNDPNRVITFNPSDIEMSERMDIAEQKIIEAARKVDVDDKDKISIIEADNIIKEQVDYIFGSPVANIIFGSASPMAPVKGVPLYVHFIEAVIPKIENQCKAEAEATRKKIEKYRLR